MQIPGVNPNSLQLTVYCILLTKNGVKHEEAIIMVRARACCSGSGVGLARWDMAAVHGIAGN